MALLENQRNFIPLKNNNLDVDNLKIFSFMGGHQLCCVNSNPSQAHWKIVIKYGTKFGVTH
jgi:hypothetical protein